MDQAMDKSGVGTMRNGSNRKEPRVLIGGPTCHASDYKGSSDYVNWQAAYTSIHLIYTKRQ